MEFPGAPSVHAASLFMRVRTLTDIVGCFPSFSSPSFSFAKDNRYLTILSNSNGFPSSTQRSEAQFHIPLASLCQSSTYGDAWETPLEFWSKDVTMAWRRLRDKQRATYASPINRFIGA
ncbi:hypothetical protein BS47DRAFT_1394858 [Hydnum rufescens UP504]|uniref:Uncharacterized protein n=1 Tax=Hydnum rufescens UP504 TaxID=1448309 RepID=A0A9P6DS45_9AGAM|nr:hypothetical protein BS47DRAFT_1394858 [Hydnum rufescens UP504]